MITKNIVLQAVISTAFVSTTYSMNTNTPENNQNTESKVFDNGISTPLNSHGDNIWDYLYDGLHETQQRDFGNIIIAQRTNDGTFRNQDQLENIKEAVRVAYLVRSAKRKQQKPLFTVSETYDKKMRNLRELMDHTGNNNAVFCATVPAILYGTRDLSHCTELEQFVHGTTNQLKYRDSKE